MANRRVRFAVVGTGNFSPFFARYLLEVSDIVAVCDPRREARARFLEMTGLAVHEFDDHERMLQAVDVDAVAITRANHIHKPVTIAAARAGRHVFCEKPMALTVAECWEMVRACEASHVRLMVGHKRLRPPWARMLEFRQQLGPVVAISTVGYFDSRPDDFRGWWTRACESGGTLALSGVHELDWMRAMAGDVEAVSAVAAPQIDGRFDFPDSLHVSLRFRSGAVGFLGVSLSYPLRRYREVCGADVVCSQGGMRLVTGYGGVDLYWRRLDDAHTQHERFEPEDNDPVGTQHAFRKEIGDFICWVTEGIEPCLTWREGLRCGELMEAARYSVNQDGAWVRLPLYPELEEPDPAQENPEQR